MKNFLKMLAYDFGASNCRAILGNYDGSRIEIEEIHRFPNEPVSVTGHYYWDVLRLFHEVKQGLLKCSHTGNADIRSIAIDTWGVDFALLDKKGYLLSNPFHYRDVLTDGIMEVVFDIIPKQELYQLTGLQFVKINSLFQLFAMKYRNLTMLKEADTMLMISDLFNYFLTGVKTSEYTIASTTQLLDPETKQWSNDVITRLQLPEKIFPGIVKPGTVLENLSSTISDECGIGKIPVIATATHDTAAAVASVPAEDNEYVYISCGTWSIMGIEVDKPIINQKTYRLLYSNEGSARNRIKLLKMIMGLWLVQECRRQWIREGRTFDFSELEAMALSAELFKSFIDPDDERFMPPGDMPARIVSYCNDSGQPAPESVGEIICCILQSLALKYRKTVEDLENILGKHLPIIHIVGGGTKNAMLCRFTSNATGRKAIAGPAEATSVGNLVVQGITLGEIKDFSEGRQIVMRSFPVDYYEPRDTDKWNEAYDRFLKVTGKMEK